MLTLWDLLPTRRKPPEPVVRTRPRQDPGLTPMQQRYRDLTRLMLDTHGVRVRKWRSSMSGVAWEVHYRDGTVSRLIEAPQPRGPMSCAVFLHEIGHHAIGFKRYRPRCLEEYHAWMWALDTMEAHSMNITPSVRRRVHESLYYAIHKARRRGIKRLPPELHPYATPPMPHAPQRQSA
ncbi:MAG: hypothetical protein ACF8GE_09220 [Phycisphaerales bacterium JB043]